VSDSVAHSDSEFAWTGSRKMVLPNSHVTMSSLHNVQTCGTRESLRRKGSPAAQRTQGGKNNILTFSNKVHLNTTSRLEQVSKIPKVRRLSYSLKHVQTNTQIRRNAFAISQQVRAILYESALKKCRSNRDVRSKYSLTRFQDARADRHVLLMGSPPEAL
jgi:hypothetical protein